MDVVAEAREILSYRVGSWLAVHIFDVTDKTAWIHWSVKYRMPSQIVVGSYCELRRGILLDGRSPLAPSIVIGKHCRLKENVALMACGGKITLEDHVLLGPNTRIFGHGGVVIGKNTMFGGGISVSSANYACALNRRPFQCQGYILKPVKISSNVWIGDNSCIVGGVTIEQDVIVGAGSVVTHDLESGFVYAGNPARKVGRIQESLPSRTKITMRSWRSFAKEMTV